MSHHDFPTLRHAMIRTQLATRDILDPRVLAAMGEVPRERFVPAEIADLAYVDGPLSIGQGQTISQPYIVALMTQALEIGPEARVLEIGTGSGYGAAILSRLARVVYTVERHASLAAQAGERFAVLGYTNVHAICANGSLGWPEHAPYDGISVTAAGPAVPKGLVAQLAVGGKLVIPVGSLHGDQRLLRVTRDSEPSFTREDLGPVRFVPLIGAGGFGDGRGVSSAEK